jgi:GGDEF domain-containing protein
MAQRLREAIADLPLPVTASIGTASIALAGAYARDHDRVITELIDAADQAMYAAKRAGGDRVTHFSGSALQPVADR